MQLQTVSGFYGSGRTPCDVYVATNTRTGLTWYVAEGGQTVNATYDDVSDGVNIEELADVDCFTVSAPIESKYDLEDAINA